MIRLILTMKNDPRPRYLETDLPDFDAAAKAIADGASLTGERIFAERIGDTEFIIRARAPFMAAASEIASIQLVTYQFHEDRAA